jgi:hypothetical protein
MMDGGSRGKLSRLPLSSSILAGKKCDRQKRIGWLRIGHVFILDTLFLCVFPFIPLPVFMATSASRPPFPLLSPLFSRRCFTTAHFHFVFVPTNNPIHPYSTQIFISYWRCPTNFPHGKHCARPLHVIIMPFSSSSAIPNPLTKMAMAQVVAIFRISGSKFHIKTIFIPSTVRMFGVRTQ